MAVGALAVSWSGWALDGARFAAWAVAGALAWTLAEYALHRLDMHGRRSRGATRREHLRHHATVDVPALTADTWAGAAIVAVALGWWGHLGVGVGWMAAYVGYELLHRALHLTTPAASGAGRADGRWADSAHGPGDSAQRAHRRTPWGRYRRWALGHHLHHHHVDARRNYGVTTPLWDHAFRTHARPSSNGTWRPAGDRSA